MTSHSSTPRWLSTPNRELATQVVTCACERKCCALLGPRFAGKSAVLSVVRSELQQKGTFLTAYINLESITPANHADFFGDLAGVVVEQLMLKNPNRGLRKVDVGTSAAFRGFLREVVEVIHSNLVLLIDHLDALPGDLLQALLTSLRATYMSQREEENWVIPIVGGALSLASVTVGEASPFENIAEVILVGDLTEEQDETLLDQYLASPTVSVSQSGRELLVQSTRGSPYLMDRICSECIKIGQGYNSRRVTVQTVRRVVSGFLEDEVADYEPLQEALRLVEENPELLTCVLRLLEDDLVRRNTLPLPLSTSPALDPLYLTGLVRIVDGNYYTLRNEIYRKFLLRHFDPGRVGHLLTMSGRWDRAIDYLSNSLVEGEGGYRSDLLAAIFGSMYASDHDTMVPITTERSQSFGPKMYAKHGITNPGLHLPDQFLYMARNYCGAPQYNIPMTKPHPSHLGVFWCPSKEFKKELKIGNQPYVSGSAVAIHYARSGQAYPLPVNIQNDGKALYGGEHDTGPFRLNRSKDPSIWPLFFDEKVYSDDRYGVVDNHPRVLNAVYLDGSAATQLPDPGFRGNNYGQNNGDFVVWHLPYVRHSPMPW